MTTIYTKSLSSDFSSNLNSSQFHIEVDGDGGITPNILGVNVTGDVVDIIFDAALSGAEQTTLDGLITAHTPVTPDIIPDIFISPDSDVMKFIKDATTYKIIGNQTDEIIISKGTQGDYTSIKDAITNNNNPNTIFKVYPGTYVENNPITLPTGSSLMAAGTPGNTTIVAQNPGSDIIILSPWCKIEGFAIYGASTAGSRGIYFDGSVNGAAYSAINQCIIQHCDIGIETENGPDTLICYRTLVHPTAATLAKGIYVHSGGQFVGSSVRVTGVPTVPLYITDAFICAGAGSKLSLTTASGNYCTTSLNLDNGGNFELTLYTTNGCGTGLYIGSTGTTSKIRATALNMIGSTTYDIDVQATDAEISLFSSEIDGNIINNPNSVIINAKFYSFKDNKKFQTITGDLRIGTLSNPSTVMIGEGKYKNSTITVFSNDNLEAGTWVDNTTAALSSDNSTFNLFQAVTAGNCLYVGSTSNIYGIKANVTTTTTSTPSKSDVIAEYWDGSAWTSLNSMQLLATSPYYHNMDSFVTSANKQHIRYNVTSATNMPNKTLNSVNKKWIRYRIVNAITGLPQAEYIKLHTNAQKINKDGYTEYFGNSRGSCELNFNTYPSNSTPGSQEIFLADNLSVAKIDNKFADGSVTRIGLSTYVKICTDTSFPIKLHFAFMGDSDTTGDVEWKVRYALTTSGSSVYHNATDAPSEASGVTTVTKISSIAVNSKNKDIREVIELNIENINVNPSSGDEHIMFISLERDASGGNSNDTYPGAVSIFALKGVYVSWSESGHILSY
uniref:Uncharacterized protein n=1 Tax=Mimivirus LCMiAC02 TaxID=2506609 RepID=A0A481Z142_9VIRU|nr:MAG: hypothetical protein LCMiAC02_05420 [Mimivirus LCMiAC02]